MASHFILRSSCHYLGPKNLTCHARMFASTAQSLAGGKGNTKGTGYSATKGRQVGGFGNKKRKKHIRKGGQLRFAHPSSVDVDFGPRIQRLPIGLDVGKPGLLNVFGTPRSLEKELLSHIARPFAVIRDVTLSTFERMQAAAHSSSRDNRFVFTGPTGCGKSVTLLQTVEYCAKQGWFIVYVPQAIRWVDSTTPFQYDSHSQTFLQPSLAQDVLKQLASFNKNALTSLTLAEDVAFERSVLTAGSTLRDLVEVGINDPASATLVLRLTLDHLAKQDSIPVLLAIDDLHALYGTSLYRDPEFNHVQALHLSMPRLILEYASGNNTLTRGAVVGALSTTSAEFPVPVELQDALGLNSKRAEAVWMKRKPEYCSYAKGLIPIQVPPQFSVAEAASLVEVWNHAGALHSDLNDSVFLAKLAETGGNPRQFFHRGYMSSLVAL